MAIENKCTEATVILMGEDGEDNIEGVDSFKYMGRLLNWLEYDWPTVLKNIWKPRKVWGSLGKFLH